MSYYNALVHSPNDLTRPRLLNYIGQLAQSKLAIMDRTGYIATVGGFINERGLLFSNTSYQAFRYR